MALIRPILFSFLLSKQVKQLVIDLLQAYAASTENQVDDKIVASVKKALM